jgi:hypothetical protein
VQTKRAVCNLVTGTWVGLRMYYNHVVNREFKVAIRDKFFKKNTFEVHDSIATLAKHHKKNVSYTKTVASEWLTRVSKLGHLNSIRKPKLDLRFNEVDQTQAQSHRICTAAASMEMLERLVVTIDATGFWYFPLYEVA